LGYLNTTTYQTDSASFSTRILNSQPIGYLTTASYQTDSASFSSRINAGGTISSSGQITLSATTEYSTFSASLATTDSASAATTTFLSTSVASRLATQEFKSTIFATTGSNSFTGSQNITGSLTVSSVATISSSIAANASSLTLSNGSNLYIQNNGVAEISGSLNVSGSTTFTGSISISSGSITMPNRPAFRVYGAGGGTAATTVLSGSMTIVDYNQGGWDNTTGTFTAPIAGLYQVNIVARCIGNANPSAQVIVYKNNTTTSPSPNGTAQIMVEWAANTTANHVGGSTITKLAVGDTLKAVVALGTISFDGNDNFSVAYIG
jgi:hypothetical protein